MAKALITGITGFVGSHLAEHLLDQGLEVHGAARWRCPTDNIKSIEHQIKMHNMDIRDLVSCWGVISTVKPDYIFHLASQSYVPESWNAPAETLSTNIIGTANILEAVRKAGLTETIIHFAGSSEEYGLVHPDEVPIRESQPLRPQSPYGVSKAAGDLLCQQYYKSYGMRTIITRAFNHEGPRRGDVFVTSNFAKQIVMIEKGKAPAIIKVGNLDAMRDYSDARDIVRAYKMATTDCLYGEPYNVCSGRQWVIKDVLKYLLTLSPLGHDIRICPDPARMRPSDVPNLVGDCTKFKDRTGWAPVIPFEQTLLDTMEYWRARL